MLFAIILNLIVLAFLILPAVRGYVNGFVKTTLRFFRFLGAFVLALLFSKPLGKWIKEKWLERKFYRLVDHAVSDSFNGSVDSMADGVPSGFRSLLESFHFNIGEAANDSVAKGGSMLENFVNTIADKLSSVASVALAFAGIFLFSLLALLFVAKLLTFLVERIPLVRGLNHLAGLGVGFLIGVFSAWTAAQVIVFTLTTFTGYDYSNAAILKFFHDISPLRWMLQFMVQSMTGNMV